MEINADHWQDQVDASSPVPLYAQLRSIIESHLDSDGYRAGDRLPSQSKLMARFKVSLPTVRQALSSMVADGSIVRQRGVGTVLVPTKPRDATLLHLVVSRGFTKAAADGAVENVIDADGRAPTTSMMKVERAIRNGVRIGVCRTWLADRLVPILDDDLNQDYLLGVVADLLGAKPVIAELTIHTVKASTADLTDLELGPGLPVLVVETAWTDRHGAIVIRSHVRWRGDQVCVDLATGGGPPHRVPAEPATTSPNGPSAAWDRGRAPNP